MNLHLKSFLTLLGVLSCSGIIYVSLYLFQGVAALIIFGIMFVGIIYSIIYDGFKKGWK